MAINKRQQFRLLILLAFIAISYIATHYSPAGNHLESSSKTNVSSLYDNRQSDVQIEISAKVVRILPDDTKGSRHQRFIVELSDKNTVLVSHNIDLAPRIENLNAGDDVTVYGEYEWNDKGGVLHWTHHDPANKHPHGWIRHNGQLYQ